MTLRAAFKVDAADHKIIIFQNHDGFKYDALKKAFAAVYGNLPEEVPFDFVGFDACISASYELANTFSDFSHYMMSSESNSDGRDCGAFFLPLTVLGFSGAFARAADKLFTSSATSAVPASKVTYCSYISEENIFSETGSRNAVESMNNSFDYISKQDSSYSAQKELYENFVD